MTNKKVSILTMNPKKITIIVGGFVLLVGFALATYAALSPADVMAQQCVGPLKKYLSGQPLTPADNAALGACYQNGSCTNSNLSEITNSQGVHVCAQALNEWQNKYSAAVSAPAAPANSPVGTAMTPTTAPTTTTTTTTTSLPATTSEPTKSAPPAPSPFNFKDTNNAVPSPVAPTTTTTTTHSETTTAPEKTEPAPTAEPATAPEKQQESVNWF